MHRPALTRGIRCSVILAMVLVVGCETDADTGNADSENSEEGGPEIVLLSDLAEELGPLTTQMQEDMLLRNDMTRYESVMSENYMVMIPGGRLENREEVIAGAVNFDVESVTFSDVETRTHGFTAVVTGVWTVSGRLRDIDMSGDYGFIATYEWFGNAWQLVSESVTRHRGSMEAALSG